MRACYIKDVRQMNALHYKITYKNMIYEIKIKSFGSNEELPERSVYINTVEQEEAFYKGLDELLDRINPINIKEVMDTQESDNYDYKTQNN